MNSFLNLITAGTLALATSLTFANTVINPPVKCANGRIKPGTCKRCDGTTFKINTIEECVGANAFVVSGFDSRREVTDLQIWGGVGEHTLEWTRHGRSRRAMPSRFFGKGHNWRHSYQWDFNSAGSGKFQITYPEGAQWEYEYDGVANAWVGRSDSTDLLTQSGTTFTLHQPNGFKYIFTQHSYGGGTIYRMTSFKDSIGNTYTCTYDSEQKLTRVTEPAGRYLQISYTTVQSNNNAFPTIASIGTTAPPDQWNELTVSDTTAYRYLRYFGNDWNWCNVAEVEFYDNTSPTPVKLTGSVFGNTPANSSTTTIDKAFDGNTATYYKYMWPTLGFVGIDLGSGNQKQITKVRYRPRSGLASYMTNGLFQGSNVAPITSTVISKVETNDGREVNYNYEVIADTAVPEQGWVALESADYDDATSAEYNYTMVWGGYYPLLGEANDPRYQGEGRHIKYEFWENAQVFGMLKLERNPENNAILIQNTVGETNDEVVIVYPGGREQVFTYTSDDLDRVSAYKDELGNTKSVSFANDGAGLIESSTDELNRTTSYTYDSLGNVLTVTYPDSSVETWTRDSAGRTLTHTEARLSSDPYRTITYIRATNTTRLQYGEIVNTAG